MTSFKRFRIKNFKSIKDINFEFDHLNILIGMNGAGKSTILQAMDFLSQLMHGKITDWLDSRDWKASDLNCKLLKESNISLEVDVQLNNGLTLQWCADFNRTTLKCTHEVFKIDDQTIAVTKSRTIYFILSDDKLPLNLKRKGLHVFFEFQGSILSQMSLNALPFDYSYVNELDEFQYFIRNIKSLELLAPHLMRKSTRTNEDFHIGIGGEKLSSFLSTLHIDQKEKLLNFLKSFYPNISDFKIINQRSGWKKLIINEVGGVLNIENEARHINDGLLRILAILAQLQSEPGFLMLDEIENGVNQEIVEKLVDILLKTETQLLITTHSPLVLNYLPDDVAIEAIKYIYKSEEGDTRYKRFFDIPSAREKLEVMGVGDAVLDTNLIELKDSLNGS